MNTCSVSRACPRLHDRLLTLCPAAYSDPVPRGQLWPTGSVGAGHRVSRAGSHAPLSPNPRPRHVRGSCPPPQAASGSGLTQNQLELEKLFLNAA